MEFRAELEMKKGNPRKQGDMEGGTSKSAYQLPSYFSYSRTVVALGETQRSKVERNN